MATVLIVQGFTVLLLAISFFWWRRRARLSIEAAEEEVRKVHAEAIAAIEKLEQKLTDDVFAGSPLTSKIDGFLSAREKHVHAVNSKAQANCSIVELKSKTEASVSAAKDAARSKNLQGICATNLAMILCSLIVSVGVYASGQQVIDGPAEPTIVPGAEPFVDFQLYPDLNTNLQIKTGASNTAPESNLLTGE